MNRKGRIRHSLAYWCLNATEWQWDIERICETAVRLGCESVELAPPELWPVLSRHGLKHALSLNGMPDPVFAKGLNNPRHHEEIFARTKAMIDCCADFGVPNVIAFTGYKWLDPADPRSGEIRSDEGAANTVKGLRELARYAAPRNVTIVLEQLNTRDDSHPMKGHPGYQGDDIDYCAAIVRNVDSPHVKLLFDVYHVAIMNGDVIRRLRQYAGWIGHIHVAGVPGRGELDTAQEIHYPAVMRTLIETGYQGYVGQEFIPTRDPGAGLAEAVELCDV
ncbi:MAG TPA: TIM barrel protein [Bryobacteraceae bacterium]|nr:TIM barrel protein [Bryobacteraceae bacterium]HTS29718.1 TIM barrel protein [Bryobacteraceae bacterium]